jgi:hypothetical protein
MPAKSRAAKARRANAQHARNVLLETLHTENLCDDEAHALKPPLNISHDFGLPHPEVFDDDEEGNMNSENLDDLSPEELEETARAHRTGGTDQYTEWLEAAVKILAFEGQACKDKKRKHTYEGNSDTSKWRAVKRKEKLATQGFPGLKEFLEAQKAKVSLSQNL